MANPPKIDPLSLRSLRVDLLYAGTEIGQGTACTAEHDGNLFLLTNWHLASGCHAETEKALHKQGSIPDQFKVWHTIAGNVVAHAPITYDIRDDDDERAPLWLEHPTHGHQVDVVALPIDRQSEFEYFTHDLDPPSVDIELLVGADVVIVGFPFGQTSGGALPVWTRAMISSEPDLDFEHLPRMLVDSRTRDGASGSPCALHIMGTPSRQSDGNYIAGIEARVFLGIYSGRIDPTSDLGWVWKRDAVRDIVHNGVQGHAPYAPQ